MKYSFTLVFAAVAVAAPQAPQAAAPVPATPPRPGLPSFPVQPKVGPDGKPLPQCLYIKDIKPLDDPLKQYKPRTANFPCDMGAAIPFGPVPKGCAKYEVLVARGTSEPGDFGSMVGDPLIARIKRDMPGVAVRGYPVQYPADGSIFAGLTPGKLPSASVLAEIAAHSTIGPNDILYRLGNQTRECPDEKFALVGYSQGGAVVYKAATTIAKNPALADKVVAVVFYGAGDGSKLALDKKTMLANCARGDMACPEEGNKNPATPLGHVSYNDEGTKWHDRSAAFIVSAFNGKELGPKLKKTGDEPL